jgi:hypothetical protein
MRPFSESNTAAMRAPNATQPSIAPYSFARRRHGRARQVERRTSSNQLHWDMNRDAILTELLELEAMLQDDHLNDHDCLALAASAAQRICNPPFSSEIVHGPERCQGSLMKVLGNISLVWSFQA